MSKLIKKLKLTVLVEDSASLSRSDLIAKHGLSILLEGKAKGKKFFLLLDTGPSAEIVLHNAKVIGLDLRKTFAVFLSHGHYDHTGGLVGILKHIGRKALVMAHPKVFDVKLKLEPNLKNIGSPFKLVEVEACGGLVLMARNPIPIINGIMTSGEIERKTTYEKVEGFWTIEKGNFKEDIMLDDQALALNIKEKGLVIISGCAHAGIINTIRQAQKVTGTNKIHAVLGGFHLIKAGDKRIQSTIDELVRIDPRIVGPCHCTGSNAVNRLIEAFGDRCKPLKTGDVIEL